MNGKDVEGKGYGLMEAISRDSNQVPVQNETRTSPLNQLNTELYPKLLIMNKLGV
jgi:hypothetical protein